MFSVNELEAVILYCNKDTVMSDFIDSKTFQLKLKMILQ